MDRAETPALPRGVRLHHDRVRDKWVLLAPERAVALDPVGLAVLQQVDGTATFGQITDRLAAAYDAPVERIATDAAAFLTGLRNRMFLEVT